MLTARRGQDIGNHSRPRFLKNVFNGGMTKSLPYLISQTSLTNLEILLLGGLNSTMEPLSVLINIERMRNSLCVKAEGSLFAIAMGRSKQVKSLGWQDYYIVSYMMTPSLSQLMRKPCGRR